MRDECTRHLRRGQYKRKSKQKRIFRPMIQLKIFQRVRTYKQPHSCTHSSISSSVLNPDAPPVLRIEAMRLQWRNLNPIQPSTPFGLLSKAENSLDSTQLIWLCKPFLKGRPLLSQLSVPEALGIPSVDCWDRSHLDRDKYIQSPALSQCQITVRFSLLTSSCRL